jgi:hypothetical protein
MKNILLITFLLLTYLSGFSQHGRPANELFDEAIAKAKKEKKSVFLRLGSCPTTTVRKIYGDFLYNILLAFCGLPPQSITML